MLPIAAEIAGRMTRDHAGSALPNAPTMAVGVETPRQAARRPRRTVATVLRRVALGSQNLADRVERPLTAD